MSDRIKDLLHEVADGIAPGDRLDAIRAETSGGRRTGRAWWAAGGVGLIAASVVTAVALSTGGTPSSDPDPAQPAPTSPSETATDPVSSEPPPEAETSTVAVYYIGDTPNGPRLYREFRRVPAKADKRLALVSLGLAPLDPDYRSAWPAKEILDVAFDGVGADGLIQVSLTDESVRARPAGMDEETARLGVEQAIYTAQAAFAARAPVQFMLNGNPVDQVFGVPTAEPLAAGDLLSTLAHVSLTEPSEGERVDNDEPFTVTGVGNSFEGNIVTRIQRWEGTYIVDQIPAIAGMGEDRLFPFEVTFDLTGVPPGDYVVISQTDDPSGAGMFDTDTRRITIVD